MSEFLKIVSSQYKHLPYRSIEFIDKRVISDGNTLRNQPFSFQVLYKSKNDACEPVTLSAETELPIAADELKLPYNFADPTYALARAAILFCGYETV